VDEVVEDAAEETAATGARAWRPNRRRAVGNASQLKTNKRL